MAGTFDAGSVFIPLEYQPNSVFQTRAMFLGYERLLRDGIKLGDIGIGLTGKFGTVYLMKDWARRLQKPGDTPLALKESRNPLFGIGLNEDLHSFLGRTPDYVELWRHFHDEYSALVDAKGLEGHAPKAHAFGCVRTYNEIRFAFVMDWLGDDSTKTLDQYVPPQGIPAGEVAYVGALLCQALNHLHRINRSHRDLKADNIFVSFSDVIGTHGRRIPKMIKLVDLGQSGSFETRSEDYQTSTFAYCGPELFVTDQDPRYHMQNDASFDVWMIGAVLYFMRTGHDPTMRYEFDNPLYLKEKERGLQLPPAIMRYGDRLDMGLNRIIQNCTKAQPYERPNLLKVEAGLARLAAQSGDDWPALSIVSSSLTGGIHGKPADHIAIGERDTITMFTTDEIREALDAFSDEDDAWS